MRLLERVGDRWKAFVRDGEPVSGPAAFPTARPGDFRAPDELDFLLGHSLVPAPETGSRLGMALHFVPLAAVSSLALDDAPARRERKESP